ncbi:MAG: hypothetical protein FJY17_09635 [Bacteroidetes bacterium]|nr:hypothetical protein [Bacteroidota bacterium]
MQKVIPSVSIYIFTSPSNVKSFLANNIIHANARIIAWGSSTKEFLNANNIKVNDCLTSGHENELIQILELSNTN